MAASVIISLIAASGGSTNVGTALIAAAAAVVGVVVTLLGTVYAANKRVAEVRETYRQRLQDVYLENARTYLNSVYLPLHLALAGLVVAYRRFLLSLASETVMSGGPRK